MELSVVGGGAKAPNDERGVSTAIGRTVTVSVE